MDKGQQQLTLRELISKSNELEKELERMQAENDQLEAEIQSEQDFVSKENKLESSKNPFQDRLENDTEVAAKKAKERLETVVNQVNSSENEQFNLLSISATQLTAAYTLFEPNHLKDKVLLQLQLQFLLPSLELSSILNTQIQQYLTPNQLTSQLATLTHTYHYSSNSLFLHSLSLQSSDSKNSLS